METGRGHGDAASPGGERPREPGRQPGRGNLPGGEEPVLEFRGLRFRYGGPAILDGVDLAVTPGEMVGILGPNGAGKTTLLRLATGLLNPAAGSARLFGREAREIPPRERARMVAVVPQEARSAFDYTVREIVMMGRAPHLGLLGVEGTADRRATEEALRFTDTLRLADARLSRLSGGERQRVWLARALAQEAPLLLLDEPTAFLDLRHRLAVYDVAARLREERGCTVVAVSHDLNLAARFCQRIVLLRDGKVAADGPAERVITAATIRTVYDVEVHVGRHPASGVPQVLL